MKDKNKPGCCEIGTYECSELAFVCECCGHTVWVDKCLKEEIKSLHDDNIATIGCCCGHGEAEAYVQVRPNCVDVMLDKGYEPIPPVIVDGLELGPWCFKPKSKLGGDAE